MYKGLFTINNDYFYTQPLTMETPSYVKYRTTLITDGVCVLRDRAIRGEITLEEFWDNYRQLKENGLAQVMEEAGAAYESMMAGSDDS